MNAASLAGCVRGLRCKFIPLNWSSGQKGGEGAHFRAVRRLFPPGCPTNVLLKFVVAHQLKGGGNIEEKGGNDDRGPGEWVRADGLPFISDSPPCIVSSDTLPKS